MTCKCGSNKFLSVSGKTSDMCAVELRDSGKTVTGRDGYIPSGMGIGSGDYINFSVCITCGTIKNWKPLTDEEIIEVFE